MTTLALDVGCELTFLPQIVGGLLPGIKDLKIIGLDANPDNNPDVLQDITQPFPEIMKEKYDIVYASHVLEHIPWRQAPGTFAALAELLKPGGHMIVIVPSMEWAARQITRGVFDVSVLGVFYGGQMNEFHYHKCGYTRATLKKLATMNQLEIKKIDETFYVVIVDGREYDCMQNLMLARKPE